MLHRIEPPLSCPQPGLTLLPAALGLLLIACGQDKAPAPPAPPPPPPAAPAPAPKAAAPAARPPDQPVDPPASVTLGDVLPALPTPAPRLFDGQNTVAVLPAVSCAALRPDRDWVLGSRVEVARAPQKKGEAGGTLELCVFSKVSERADDQQSQHAGKDHHFVAAFPGTEVAAFTAEPIVRQPTSARPEWALPRAAGWSALLPTGLPDQPAVAVVSARFYDGPLGEQVHWIRRAHLLTRGEKGWSWKPMTTRDFTTLDTAHLLAACERPEASSDAVCLGAEEKVEAFRRTTEQRAEVRVKRLATESGRKPKKGAELAEYPQDGDPQSAWLRDGRVALQHGQWRLAIDAALRIEVVCGEPIKEARTLIAAALKKAGLTHERPAPPVKPVPLCEPLSDKGVPKRPG